VREGRNCNYYHLEPHSDDSERISITTKEDRRINKNKGGENGRHCDLSLFRFFVFQLQVNKEVQFGDFSLDLRSLLHMDLQIEARFAISSHRVRCRIILWMETLEMQSLHRSQFLIESLSFGLQLIKSELSTLANEHCLDRSNRLVQFENRRPNHERACAIDLRTDTTDSLEHRIALCILSITFQPACLSEHCASMRRVCLEFAKTDVSVEIDIDVTDTILPSLELVVLIVSQDHWSLAHLREETEREMSGERQRNKREKLTHHYNQHMVRVLWSGMGLHSVWVG
jgi:hypothetical protein